MSASVTINVTRSPASMAPAVTIEAKGSTDADTAALVEKATECAKVIVDSVRTTR